MATVRSLFGIGRPPAVSGGVGPAVVDAFQCQALAGGQPHVGSENRKVVPARIDDDASTSVVFVGRASRVIAAVSHRCPYPVQFGVAIAMGAAVLGARHAASAPFAFAGTQISGQDFFLSSTITVAYPVRAFIGVAIGDDGPAAETLAGKVNTNGHGSLSKRLSDLSAGWLAGSDTRRSPPH